MITLQEAERLLEHAQAECDPVEEDTAVSALSRFLTVLVAAGAFRPLDATMVRGALMQEGVTASAAEYAVRVLRKLGVVS